MPYYNKEVIKNAGQVLTVQTIIKKQCTRCGAQSLVTCDRNLKRYFYGSFNIVAKNLANF